MKGQKVMVIVGALVICLVAVIGIYINLNLDSTLDTLKFIKERYRGGGVFVDYDHSIEVNSIADIGYYKKKGDWYVIYGKMELKFTLDNIQDPVYQAAIKAVDLDVKGSIEDNELVWYWCGQELAQWVPH